MQASQFNSRLFAKRGEVVDVSKARFRYLYRPLLSPAALEQAAMGMTQQNTSQFKVEDEDELRQKEQRLLQMKKHSFAQMGRNTRSTNFLGKDAEREDDEKGAKDMAVQTLYRENEVQTDPFSPPVVFYKRNKDNPNELIVDLEIKDTSDIDPAEDHLKILDLKRRRKIIEDNLPQGSDPISFNERVRRLKALEFIEWEEREEALDKKQEQKLEEIKKQVLLRHKVFNLKTQELLKRKEKEANEKLNSRMESLNKRRFHRAYKDPEDFVKKRDIIEDTVQLKGKYMEEGQSIAYEIRPALFTDPFGVQEIETLVKKHLTPIEKGKIFAPPEIDKRSTLTNLKIKPISQPKKMKTLRELYKATPRFERPPTPELIIESDSNEAEERELAVIFVQKFLKGRAIQEEIRKGKNKTLDLIRELQAVENVKEEEEKRRKMESEEEKRAKQQKKEQQEKEEKSKQIVETIQGEIVARALDYLSKELVRQQDMFLLEQLRVRAEAERLQREEEETRERIQEENYRENYQQLYFNEIISVHQETAESFLEDIFAETVQRTAETEALKDVMQKLETEEAERQRKHEEKERHSAESAKQEEEEEEIKDLVQNLLFPMVKKELVMKRVREHQKKYLNSVFSSVLNPRTSQDSGKE